MSQVSDALTTLVKTLGTDELAVVLPIADAYFVAIQQNPAPDNVVAQSLKLEAEVLTALPSIEAAAAKDVAAALKNLVDLEAASLAAPVATAAVATPATSA